MKTMDASDTDLYFAYGNNMRAATMLARLGPNGHAYRGLARLDGYRLTFTTRTPEWGGRVADLTRSEGDSVYGVLYAVTQGVWEGLAPHEPTYERVAAEVVGLPMGGSGESPVDPVLYAAIAYCVRDSDKEPEGPPEPRYLERIILGAGERGLPAAYLAYLESFRASDSPNQA